MNGRARTQVYTAQLYKCVCVWESVIMNAVGFFFS